MSMDVLMKIFTIGSSSIPWNALSPWSTTAANWRHTTSGFPYISFDVRPSTSWKRLSPAPAQFVSRRLRTSNPRAAQNTFLFDQANNNIRSHIFFFLIFHLCDFVGSWIWSGGKTCNVMTAGMWRKYLKKKGIRYHMKNVTVILSLIESPTATLCRILPLFSSSSK